VDQTFQISRDSPALFITAVAAHRLPIFRTDPIKVATCNALDEARKSCPLLIFAYVIMPDHLHLMTNKVESEARILRFIKGITARCVLGYLKEYQCNSSLEKLRVQQGSKNHEYSLWQTEKNVFSVFSESKFMEKVRYIHENPVRAGLVERAIDYRWSSARIWQGCALEDEPLTVDKDQIRWRQAR
jgi:putative transposase